MLFLLENMTTSFSLGAIYERVFELLGALGINYVNDVACILVVSLPFILTYVVTWLAFFFRSQTREKKRVPLTAPYTVPVFGHTIPFLLDAVTFVCSAT